MLAAVLLAAVLTGVVGEAPPAAAAGPCGALSSRYDPANPPRYDHVVVLMEENWSYRDFVASGQAPYLKQLSRDCGNETNFHAATHPSQPNYMAATSGVLTWAGQRSPYDNVFHQLQSRGRTWKVYAESMPQACSGASTTLYKAGHNPAYWYDDLRTPSNTCRQNDVPLAPALNNDIAADRLPAYSWIVPNKCHIFYWSSGCPGTRAGRIGVGDQWLAGMLPRLLAMPSYQAGRTLILITFDEGRETTQTRRVDCTDPAYYSGHPDCQIPTVVVSPYIVPGTTDGRDLNLYGLLGTVQDILGLPRLGRAVGQPSLRSGLRF